MGVSSKGGDFEIKATDFEVSHVAEAVEVPKAASHSLVELPDSIHGLHGRIGISVES